MKIRTRLFLGLSLAALGAVPALPANITPDLSPAPTGWTTDRYQPNSFGNAGTQHGVDNVLQIGISAAQDSASRAGTGQADTFYNTQGMSHPLTGGPGDNVSVQLYIPSAWSNGSTNGDVRTDLWVTVDGAAPFWGILGFTNFGTNNRAGDTAATFQIWDSGTGTWTAVNNAVAYDAWNTLDILYTGTEIDYFINGGAAGVVTSLGADAGNALSSMILEAYNYGDPNFGATYGNAGAVPNNTAAYVVSYANTPEPTTMGLVGLGLAGLGFLAKKRRKA